MLRSAVPLAMLALVGGLATVVLAADTLAWPGTTPVNRSQSPLNRARQPSISAGDTGTMVLAWSDEELAGDRQIWAATSGDDGHSWSAPQEVASVTGKDLQWPGTAVYDGRCFVAWSEQTVSGDHIFNVYETELGTGTERLINGSLGYQWPSWPRLAQDGEKLHVVFHGGGFEPDVLYASRYLTSTDEMTATTIYTHTGDGSFYPALAVEPGGDTLHVVWEERAGAHERKILYMEGDVSGPTISWSAPVTLSKGITLSVWPSVVADSTGAVYIAWGEQVEREAEGEIVVDHYVMFSHRGAGDPVDTWSGPDRVDPNPVKVNELIPTAVTLSTALVEDDGHVRFCVAWHGFRAGDAEQDEEILLSCTTDQGGTWTGPYNMSRTEGDEANSIWPVIAFDSVGELQGAWQERYVGGEITLDYEIYHTRRLDRRTYLPLLFRRS